eukprot:jgi/Mesvir1/18/Mv19996-RA.1
MDALDSSRPVLTQMARQLRSTSSPDAGFHAMDSSALAAPAPRGGGPLSFYDGSVGGSDVGEMEGLGVGRTHDVRAESQNFIDPPALSNRGVNDPIRLSTPPAATFNAYSAVPASTKQPRDFVVHAAIVGVAVAFAITKLGPVYNPDLFMDHETGVIDQKKLNMGAAAGGVIAALMTAFLLPRLVS